VLVRYRPNHDPFLDWVFNGADIDGQKVVWARDMGAEKNQELLCYYKDRRWWELDADISPTRLVPYEVNNQSAHTESNVMRNSEENNAGVNPCSPAVEPAPRS
jgi:hypothetical protein